MSDSFNLHNPIANKILNEDGSVTTITGEVLPSVTGVAGFDLATPFANKILQPDGTIVTLQDILGGITGQPGGNIEDIFQYVVDGKTFIAVAIGLPAKSTDTFKELAQHIENSKETLALNLVRKGVPSLKTEPLQQLSEKVGTIIQREDELEGIYILGPFDQFAFTDLAIGISKISPYWIDIVSFLDGVDVRIAHGGRASEGYDPLLFQEKLDVSLMLYPFGYDSIQFVDSSIVLKPKIHLIDIDEHFELNSTEVSQQNLVALVHEQIDYIDRPEETNSNNGKVAHIEDTLQYKDSSFNA